MELCERDVLDEFNARERRIAHIEGLRPRCSWCGGVIWQDMVLRLPVSGAYLCESCIEENEEFIEEGYYDK